MKLLQQLWDLAEREGQRQGLSACDAFGRVGLNLYNPPLLGRFGYDTTPLNTTTFAATGGDGDHFSFLHIDNQVQGSSPIVMTMPMGPVHVIVGGNLYEFLCLGYDYGYFMMHDFSYLYRDRVFKLPNPDKWIADCLEECADYFAEIEPCMLTLRQELNLKPWTNTEARLNELQQQYLPLLQLKEDNKCCAAELI